MHELQGLYRHLPTIELQGYIGTYRLLTVGLQGSYRHLPSPNKKEDHVRTGRCVLTSKTRELRVHEEQTRLEENRHQQTIRIDREQAMEGKHVSILQKGDSGIRKQGVLGRHENRKRAAFADTDSDPSMKRRKAPPTSARPASYKATQQRQLDMNIATGGLPPSNTPYMPVAKHPNAPSGHAGNTSNILAAIMRQFGQAGNCICDRFLASDGRYLIPR